MTPPRTVGRTPGYPFDRPGLTEEEVRRIARAEARALLVNVEARNVYPPRSIPLRSVDSIPVVSALPEAVDGDEVYFDTGEGLWHFRYLPGAGVAYPWVAVGEQVPLAAEVEADENTASTSWADLTTVGPSVTLPLSGEWRVRWGANGYTGDAGGAQIEMGVAVGATDPASTDVVSANSESFHIRVLHRSAVREFAAGAELRARYRLLSATTTSFLRRWVEASPIRVRST